jgi:hypothetical protein
MSCPPVAAKLFVVEEKGGKALSHVPFDLIGEHAKKDVGSGAVLGPLPYGADEKVQALHGPEDPLHLREALIAPHGVFGRKLFGSSLVRTT